MKKLLAYFFLITIILLFSVKLIYAEDQTSATPTEVAPAIATPTASVEPTQYVDSPQTLDIINDPLYIDLLSKKDIKDKLMLDENQVCKDIKDQEKSNGELVLKIIEKSKSYSLPYRKIIDNIRSLLYSSKTQKTLTFMELTKNNSTTQKDDLVKAPGTTNTSQTNDTNSTLNKKIELYNSQITSLNLAIKGMRESIKFISLESIEYDQKTKTVQKKIDILNNSISDLNTKIVEDKTSKDIEWENFCSAMNKKDLQTANTSYGNIILIKDRIVKSYQEILKLKKNIEELLLTL